MRNRITSIVLTSALGLGGIATGIVVAPAVASAASDGTSAAAAVSERVTEIREALAGLVSDGSISQAQADEVATTLSTSDALHGGHGGRGGKGVGRPVDGDPDEQVVGHRLAALQMRHAGRRVDACDQLLGVLLDAPRSQREVTAHYNGRFIPAAISIFYR